MSKFKRADLYRAKRAKPYRVKRVKPNRVPRPTAIIELLDDDAGIGELDDCPICQAISKSGLPTCRYDSRAS